MIEDDYFGDLDPSGVDIPRTVECGIRELAPAVDLHFERVAVNREHDRRRVHGHALSLCLGI